MGLLKVSDCLLETPFNPKTAEGRGLVTSRSLGQIIGVVSGPVVERCAAGHKLQRFPAVTTVSEFSDRLDLACNAWFVRDNLLSIYVQGRTARLLVVAD